MNKACMSWLNTRQRKQKGSSRQTVTKGSKQDVKIFEHVLCSNPCVPINITFASYSTGSIAGDEEEK